MAINDALFLDAPEQWDELAERCRRAGKIGLDTEFYNVDVRKQSCVGRARVHVWSVAIRTRRMDPRGYHRARGWVLPVEALTHPSLRSMLEDAAVKKCIHNQPVDDHSINNHGVRLRGAINTLDLSRWAWPGLVKADGFGLKSLMAVKLGRTPVCEFSDVVRYRTTVTREKQRKVKLSLCDCGTPGCRLRTGHTKTRSVLIETVIVEKEVDAEYPLESIITGHPRRPLLEEYAAFDAIAAVELEELAVNEPDPAPWPYATMDDPSADERPVFNQAVVDEIVLMERRGFPIDTEYAATKYELASKDEAKELATLRKWYRKNITAEDGELNAYDDEAIDDIWSSPKQLGELFDYFGFPRSPVWKKGKTKPGEIKLDGAALEWISRNHPPSAQLIGHVLQLKKIRSQMKYLLKLRDCGGHINPICGPAGDGDSRNGAVTGRLGIKGVLEAQQLPTREEVDLYQIRRAVIA